MTHVVSAYSSLSKARLILRAKGVQSSQVPGKRRTGIFVNSLMTVTGTVCSQSTAGSEGSGGIMESWCGHGVACTLKGLVNVQGLRGEGHTV